MNGREVLIPSYFQKCKKEAHTMRRKQNINGMHYFSDPLNRGMTQLESKEKKSLFSHTNH
jgi:hypothetical protein